MWQNKIIGTTGLTFDDVLLLPGESNIKREEIDVGTRLFSTVSLAVPLISSPMDTVTTHAMAIALGKLGGLGIIHRNMTVEAQAEEVKKAREVVSIVGAAVGVGKDLKERADALVKAGVRVLVVDSAQGFSKFVIEATSFLAKSYPDLLLISGNVATASGASALIGAGAKAIRVGMGPGSICTTRVIAGIGVPQITAIMEVAEVAAEANIPVIADGGIRYSGDIVKAIAAGAQAVMLGSIFASTKEAPGEVIEKDGKKFKSYRGMGSVSAMKEGSAARYGQNYRLGQEKKLTPEGVEGLVPYSGTVEETVGRLVGGLRSGMYYVGAGNIAELWQKGTFIKISQASLIESHPHDIIQTYDK